MSQTNRIRAGSRRTTIVMGVVGDYDEARIKRNAAKRQAQEDQDNAGRLMRADVVILEVIAVRCLRLIDKAGGESTYGRVCSKVGRGAEALQLAYVRGWIAPAVKAGKPVRGSCLITGKGRRRLELAQK